MRLFIGIDLPEEIKNKIAECLLDVQQTLGPKGWEHPHDYHQTLLFIGETEEAKIENIKKRMDEISFQTFAMQIKGISFFNRRIMFVDFFPSGELLKLKHEIDSRFGEYIRPDEKEFVPHVTVKRWQRYEFDRLHDEIVNKPLPQISFKVNSISLFKSERDAKNLKYHVIHELKFNS
jgi:2'-5' RNA ligase